jgi:hypothetical protein
MAVAVLLLPGSYAKAAGAKQKQLKSVVLTAEWKTLPANRENPNDAAGQETAAVPHGPVMLYDGRSFGIFSWLSLFGGSSTSESGPLQPVAVVAALHEASGAPITFKSLEFSTRTAFGSLAFGSRPTLADGKAQFIIPNRRYGSYPVHVVFPGDAEYASSSFDLSVDSSPRPLPALPQAGNLIAPYVTPPIAMPFLLFYGTMWVVFAYAFGYLILWKMRKATKDQDLEQGRNPMIVNEHQEFDSNLQSGRES